MRPSWDYYWMGFAQQASTRATCDRKHVGAVIIADKQLRSTGYNGSKPGHPHCDDVGHQMEDGHCVRTIHAEDNAIRQCLERQINTYGTTIYTTASPCMNCFVKIMCAGIRRIVYREVYRDAGITELAKLAGIELVFLPAIIGE